jgi:hypothetical protein
MLTGEPPFAEQRGGVAKMWAHVNAELPSLRERGRDVSPALEEVMRRAMARAPEVRPTAAAFGAGVLDAAAQPP